MPIILIVVALLAGLLCISCDKEPSKDKSKDKETSSPEKIIWKGEDTGYSSDKKTK